MLLTFEEYQEIGGKLAADLFELFCPRAESYVNFYTLGRIKTATRSVQEATKEIIELMAEMDDEMKSKQSSYATSGGVKSESSGSYKIEYAQTEEADIFFLQRYEQLLEVKARNIILRWLGHTGLMYRGFDRGAML